MVNYEKPSQKTNRFNTALANLVSEEDKKVEIFARFKNVFKDWVYFGNQLEENTCLYSYFVTGNIIPNQYFTRSM